MDTVELPPQTGLALGKLFGGIVFALIGGVLLVDGNITKVAALFFLTLGVPLLVTGLHTLVTKAPRLRATAEGVWFGGGAVVKWQDIKAIYEAGVDVHTRAMRTRTDSIAFEFQRKSVLFKLPPSAWLASVVSVGDLDVSPQGASSTTAALAARLEAMRVQATS